MPSALRIGAVGPRSPFGLCAAGRHGRVPLTSVARLIRPRWPCDFAHPSPRLWPQIHGPKRRTRVMSWEFSQRPTRPVLGPWCGHQPPWSL